MYSLLKKKNKTKTPALARKRHQPPTREPSVIFGAFPVQRSLPSLRKINSIPPRPLPRLASHQVEFVLTGKAKSVPNIYKKTHTSKKKTRIIMCYTSGQRFSHNSNPLLLHNIRDHTNTRKNPTQGEAWTSFPRVHTSSLLFFSLTQQKRQSPYY